MVTLPTITKTKVNTSLMPSPPNASSLSRRPLGRRCESERRVSVGEKQEVGLDPQIPAVHIEHKGAEAFWPSAFEQHGEERDQAHERGGDAEYDECDEVRDHEDDPESDSEPIAVRKFGRE